MKTQIISIRNEKSDITTDSTITRKIVKAYYEQLYASKFTSSLKDINEIFAEGKNNPNGLISIKEPEAIVKNLPAKEKKQKNKQSKNNNSVPHGFTREIYQTIKE